MIRGVEQHNEDLRRQQRTAELDSIRQKEREERERRTGVRDAERTHRRDVTSLDLESETVPSAKVSAMSGGTRESRRAGPAGPGFAARALAMGLSGAIGARKEQANREKDVKTAAEQARDRANGLCKGKERESCGETESQAHQKVEHDQLRMRDGERSSGRPKGHESERKSRSRSSRSSDEASRPRKYYRDDKEDDDDRSKPAPKRHTRQRSLDRKVKEDGRSSTHRSTRRRSASREREARSRHESGNMLANDSRKSKRLARPCSRSPSTSTLSASRSPSPDPDDLFVDITDLPDVDSSTASALKSKMDKYFSSSYNPALDVSIQDLTDPNTGLIAEGNFDEWDKMLSILKKRKEDKAFGVSRAREEERESQLRKMERKQRREDKEAKRTLKKEKNRKKRRRESDDEDEAASDDSIGPMIRSAKRVDPPRTVVLDGFEYGRKGSTRAWDLGKEGML